MHMLTFLPPGNRSVVWSLPSLRSTLWVGLTWKHIKQHVNTGNHWTLSSPGQEGLLGLALLRHKNLTQQFPQCPWNFWYSTNRWPEPTQSPCWNKSPGPHLLVRASATEYIFASTLPFSQPHQLSTNVPAAWWRDLWPQTIPTDDTWFGQQILCTVCYMKTVYITDCFSMSYLHCLFHLSQHLQK